MCGRVHGSHTKFDQQTKSNAEPGQKARSDGYRYNGVGEAHEALRFGNTTSPPRMYKTRLSQGRLRITLTKISNLSEDETELFNRSWSQHCYHQRICDRVHAILSLRYASASSSSNSNILCLWSCSIAQCRGASIPWEHFYHYNAHKFILTYRLIDVQMHSKDSDLTMPQTSTWLMTSDVYRSIARAGAWLRMRADRDTAFFALIEVYLRTEQLFI